MATVNLGYAESTIMRNASPAPLGHRESLSKKKISPHSLRHTTAVQLLQAGVDRVVIALWLGHESVETTQIYLDAN
jgi:site-specific recombinase XerD